MFLPISPSPPRGIMRREDVNVWSFLDVDCPAYIESSIGSEMMFRKGPITMAGILLLR